MFHVNFVQIAELILFSKKYSEISSSETKSGMNACDICLHITIVFVVFACPLLFLWKIIYPIDLQ